MVGHAGHGLHGDLLVGEGHILLGKGRVWGYGNQQPGRCTLELGTPTLEETRRVDDGVVGVDDENGVRI